MKKLKTPIWWVILGIGYAGKFLYRYVLKFPLLFLYALLRKIRKFFTEVLFNPKYLSSLSPLFILIVIGLLLVISNLKAKEVRPDDYGTKSLLYRLAQSPEDLADLSLYDTIQEGPQINQGPTSYIEGSLSDQLAMGASTDQDNGNFNPLLTNPDQSALIEPEVYNPNLANQNRSEIIEYIVNPGDTFSSIAQKFGLNVNTILWENNLSLRTLIRPGQKLKIMPTNGVSYIVKKGDTIKSIAKKYKIDENVILDFNKLEAGTKLATNQILIIPGASKPASPTTPSQGPSQGSAYAGLPKVQTSQAFTTNQKNFAPAKNTGARLQWPSDSYRLTQYFSFRHSGIDIGNSVGNPIYAAEAGTIIRAGWNRGGYGNYVMIEHSNGIITLYGHMHKIYVTIGQAVERGQVIGEVGSTGRSTGPHVHFEVRINGHFVNPLTYLR